ncbi:twin-arginine translocase subunit TatC [Halanaeroarchaeum sulfurireducens]|uniref:twin-arginine translocase subunit TatC n=1 Tax=Halanaeroarchaeum sulfurireducens TaxID=1604004 RepID=UPI002E1580C4
MGEDPADESGKEGVDEETDRHDEDDTSEETPTQDDTSEETPTQDDTSEETPTQDDTSEETPTQDDTSAQSQGAGDEGDEMSADDFDVEVNAGMEIGSEPDYTGRPGSDDEEAEWTAKMPGSSDGESSGDSEAATDESDAAGEETEAATDESDAAGEETEAATDESDATAEETDGAMAETGAAADDPDSTAIERKAETGPQTDEEQPLADHVEEMIKRLGIVLVIAGGVSLAAFPFAEGVITFLWYSVLPGSVSQPHVYHPLELVLTQLKTASLAGLVVALPAFVYQTYAFMRPGLYPHERRYYLAAVPTSLILALVGMTFAYFIVLPAVMNYFLYYSKEVVDIAFALGQTFNLILILIGYLALVFQIPLFIMLAIMMGLTTRQWMQDRRLIFWGVFLGVSFLFSPDPTGMAPIIVAATMVALFEGTLLLLQWTNRG